MRVRNRKESLNLSCVISQIRPIPVDARSNAWVCYRSLAGIAGLSPAEGMYVCLSVVYYQTEVSASSRSLGQGIPTECGVSECD